MRVPTQVAVLRCVVRKLSSLVVVVALASCAIAQPGDQLESAASAIRSTPDLTPSTTIGRLLDAREHWDNVACSDDYAQLNIAADYSGETYLLAYHLGSIHALRQQPVIGTLSRFVDLTAGFDSRGYAPTGTVEMDRG
jgi:hypothetical protein